MDTHTYIISLVKKLLDDNISSKELKELQRLFLSVEVQGEVKVWLDNMWKDPTLIDGDIDSKQMLEQLNRKIQRIQENPASPKPGNKQTLRVIRSMMRYAAVFILAVALSWFWFRQDKSLMENAPEVTTRTINGSNEVSVTYGSKTRIVLPDSSVVFLNSGSKLNYPPVFGQERHVTLTGEGYFMVRSDSLHPFLVHTPDVSIKALGTEFNVKAYPDEQQVETMLVKGVIEILKGDQAKPITELKPGEKATYIKPASIQQPQQYTTVPAKEHPQLVVGIEPQPDVSTGWVNNQLVFDAESFEQIAVKLERWFNVDIDIRNVALEKARLSGRYDTENIEQVMQSLQMATPFVYKIEKNKIVIR